MMELVAVWREDADAIEKAKRKGHVTTCKELRQAASRLAGFAVGLTTRSIAETPYAHGVDLRTTTEVEADRQAQIARNAAVVERAASVAQVIVDTVPVAGTDPVMDFLTGKTNEYTPAPHPEQILDDLKKEALTMAPSTIPASTLAVSVLPSGMNRSSISSSLGRPST